MEGSFESAPLQPFDIGFSTISWTTSSWIFVFDRDLATRLNKLYTDVKASQQHGFSDLKLLRDLKRCWNGRCSLCWDPEDFDLDGEQDLDIHPGGGRRR